MHDNKCDIFINIKIAFGIYESNCREMSKHIYPAHDMPSSNEEKEIGGIIPTLQGIKISVQPQLAPYTLCNDTCNDSRKGLVGSNMWLSVLRSAIIGGSNREY